MSRPLPDFAKVKISQRRFPDWFRKTISIGQEATRTDTLLKELGLHTICESGRCPNRDECYSQKTATFMIMGDVCTRSCGFCSVNTGRPQSLEADEPQRVGEAVKKLGLAHVVVTSVNRDDLEDEGAGHFVEVILKIKEISPGIIIEILTPDFKRTQREAVKRVLLSGPDIFSHNTETVPRLYKSVRPQGNYAKTLQIFRQIKGLDERVLTKSGLMLGLGETREEVLEVMKDLRSVGCEILTLGQYLQASGQGSAVKEYISPDFFTFFKHEARRMGFLWVESAPYVRSSYHAKESFRVMKKELETRGQKVLATNN